MAQAVPVGRHGPVVAGPDERGMIDLAFLEYTGQGFGLVGDNIDGLTTDLAFDLVRIRMENLDVINNVHGSHGYVPDADTPLNCPVEMIPQTLPGFRKRRRYNSCPAESIISAALDITSSTPLRVNRYSKLDCPTMASSCSSRSMMLDSN